MGVVTLHGREKLGTPLHAGLLTRPLRWLCGAASTIPLYKRLAIPLVHPHVTHLFGAFGVGSQTRTTLVVWLPQFLWQHPTQILHVEVTPQG